MADNLKTVAEVVAITGADFDNGSFSDITNHGTILRRCRGKRKSSNGKDHKYRKSTAAPNCWIY